MFADSTLFSSLWWSQPRAVPPILTLPDELLALIASHARDWSLPGMNSEDTPAEDDDGYDEDEPRELEIPDGNSPLADEDPVSLPTSLARFAATSRVFRDIVTPILLRDVQITSGKRLRALAAIPSQKLAHIRTLSIHLDADFFAEFARSLDPQFRTPQHANIRPQSPNVTYPSPPIMQILCSVLISAPLLQSFSIRLAKASSRSSAWKHFSFRSRGVSWKRTFEDSMRLIFLQREKDTRRGSIIGSLMTPHSPGKAAKDALSRFTWPHLTSLHLDALEDIGPLLQMTPNLTHLSLRMLEGYDSISCNQFLNDLRAVSLPKLKSLAFSARSLHLPDREASAARGVELLEEIGEACPKLEHLDLKVNAYSTNILPYVTVYNKSSYSVLVSVLINLQNLRTLHFPGNLFDQEEMDLFLVIGLDADERTRPDRRFALNRVARREWDAIAAMASVAPKLKTVSWVRRRDPDRRIEECSLEYSIHRMKNIVAIESEFSHRSGGRSLGLHERTLSSSSRRSPSPMRTGISSAVLYPSPPSPIELRNHDSAIPHMPVNDVDHIDLVQVHPPPRVHEIPRNISSPVQGPSFLGYARNSEGLNEFTSDHPLVSIASASVTTLILAFLVYMRFHTFLHIISIAGFIHMVYARTFVAPIAMLCVVDGVTFLSL